MSEFNAIVITGCSKTTDITYSKNWKRIYKKRYQNKQLEDVSNDAEKILLKNNFSNVMVVVSKETPSTEDAISKIVRAGISVGLIYRIT